MNPVLVVGISLVYIGFLFALAGYFQKANLSNRPGLSSWVYALSMGVYCTAWTFYGSIGKASRDGLEFLPVYLGPTLLAPVWWVVLRKMIRIAQVQQTATIADFISVRYGKSITMGAVVTLLCFLGIIPYIALQLKAISESFDLLTAGGFGEKSNGLAGNTALYVLLFMAVFTVLFGARKPDPRDKHSGIMAAVAFESLVKLLALLLAGIWVVSSFSDGMAGLFEAGSRVPAIQKLFVIRSDGGFREWFWVSALSAVAVLVLPRQFQVSVAENTQEIHLKRAMWVFPGYLFLINLFVFPLAIAGLLTFGTGSVSPDYFILALPLEKGMPLLALLVFLGGLSAAASMMVVETMALSTMFANNLLVPVLMRLGNLQERLPGSIAQMGLWSRRLAIWGILGLAWLYYIRLGQFYSLVSIGLISFVSLAQFAPALIGGIFWKRATHSAALVATLLGFLIWAYTLMLPTLFPSGDQVWIQEGPGGLAFLRPTALFGLEGYDPITHSLFWSMLVNIGAYVLVSLQTRQSALERNLGEIFVDIFQYSAVYESSAVMKGKAALPDLENLLATFFGQERSKQVIRLFAKKHNLDVSDPSKTADPRILAYTERLLSGAIGSASARMLMSGVVAEEEIRIGEVVTILKESSQILSSNRELTRKSAELRQALENLEEANQKLKENDELKDDFLATVTHELRTPITSIRAFSEILFDNPDISEADRQQYLGIIIRETERCSRLISQVLDLERYESGRQKLTLSQEPIQNLLRDALEPMEQAIREKGIAVELPESELVIPCDRDKILQVLLNLFSNAIKFVEAGSGQIKIGLSRAGNYLELEFEDNGKGIPEEQLDLIFEKFFQARNQVLRKPKGSGLGLAICRRILELHGGRISVRSRVGEGTCFLLQLPLRRDFIPTESVETEL